MTSAAVGPARTSVDDEPRRNLLRRRAQPPATVDAGGFAAGLEITKAGASELPMGLASITGYDVVTAESLAEAEKIARTCPFIASIRVYEIRSM